MTQEDPVAEYKRLLDTAHQAARAHADHERLRARDLTDEIREASKAITAAATEEGDVAKEVTGWWSDQTRHLTSFAWLDLTPPAADPTTDPRRLSLFLSEIEPATAAFRAALRRAVWPRKVL